MAAVFGERVVGSLTCEDLGHWISTEKGKGRLFEAHHKVTHLSILTLDGGRDVRLEPWARCTLTEIDQPPYAHNAHLKTPA